MAGELARQGWRSELLVAREGELARRARCTPPAGQAAWEISTHGGFWLRPWRAVSLWRGLRARKPQAVILNGPSELKIAAPLARLAGVPHIILRRGIPKPLSANPFNRLCLAWSLTGVITNSEATLQALLGRYAAALERLAPRVIHNGLEPSQWHPPAGAPPEKVIAVVARLSPEKGIDRALEALALITPQHPGALLRIAGEGPERPALEALAQRLGLSAQVEFLGQTDSVRNVMAESTVLLLPSHWEGFGFVLVEAMLLERPTVAFEGSAATEIIDPGETGFLVPAGDLPALAAAVSRLFAQPALAQRLGRNGRQRALAHFTLASAAGKLIALLKAPPGSPS